MGSQCDTCIFGNTSMKEICSDKSNASTFLHLTETTLPHRDFREANFYYVPEINACTFFHNSINFCNKYPVWLYR